MKHTPRHLYPLPGPVGREPRLIHVAEQLRRSMGAVQVRYYLARHGAGDYEMVGAAPVLREGEASLRLSQKLATKLKKQSLHVLTEAEKQAWTIQTAHHAMVLAYHAGQETLAGWLVAVFVDKKALPDGVLEMLHEALGSLAVLDAERLAAASALQMMALFLDSAADGVGIACAGSDVPLYINEAARKILRIPQVLPPGQVVPQLFRRGRKQSAERERILQHVKEHGSWTGETFLTTWEGEVVPVSEMVVLFPFAGAPSGWARGVIFRDLRPEQQHREDATQLAQFFQMIGPASQDAYFIYDLLEKNITSGAERVAGLLGYTEAEVSAIPEAWSALVHPEDYTNILSDQRRRLKQKRPSSQRYQLRLRHKAGHWETASLVLGLMQRSVEGLPQRMIARLHLITLLVGATEALRQSEALYRQIVDAIGDAALLLDGEQRVQFANRPAVRIFGREAKQLQGMALEDLVRRTDHESLGLISRVTRMECELLTRQGGAILAELRYRSLDDYRSLCVIHDLRPDMRLADATQKQTAYYRGLFQNNTSGAVMFDAQLCILSANPALGSLLRYRQHELLGRRLTDFVAIESLDAAKEHLLRMRHDRHFNRLFRHGVRLLLRRKDGRLVHTQAALTAVSDGIVLFSQGIAIFTDITAQEQARQALDQQARFNESLVTHVPVAILLLDPSGHVVRTNATLERLSGYRRKELVGKTFWSMAIVDQSQAGQFRASFRQVLEGEEGEDITLRLFTRSGGMRMVSAALTVVRGAAREVLYVIATFTDMTEAKRLEAEIIRVAEQEQMRIGNDLHDGIGQSLTGILSLTEAALTESTGATRVELDRIRVLVKEAVVQVRQLSHGLSPAAVKHRGLSASLQLLAERIHTERVSCVCHILAEPLFSDPETATHLYRVAQEAVSNAMRHALPKKIIVTLSRLTTSTGLMEISDDGQGIKAHGKGAGGGIGLAVMRYRISLIGGEFNLVTAKNEGTKIGCSFPCTF